MSLLTWIAGQKCVQKLGEQHEMGKPKIKEENSKKTDDIFKKHVSCNVIYLKCHMSMGISA